MAIIHSKDTSESFRSRDILVDSKLYCNENRTKEMRECDGLLSEVWINTVQHSEELICNIFRRPKGEEGIAIQFREISKSAVHEVLAFAYQHFFTTMVEKMVTRSSMAQPMAKLDLCN